MVPGPPRQDARRLGIYAVSKFRLLFGLVDGRIRRRIDDELGGNAIQCVSDAAELGEIEFSLVDGDKGVCVAQTTYNGSAHLPGNARNKYTHQACSKNGNKSPN